MRTLYFLAVVFGIALTIAQADESGKTATAAAKSKDQLIKLNEQGTVMLDRVGKRVLLKTTVVNREAILEFLCCLTKTREHESILGLDAKAMTVHAALLAIDAKAGSPVRFRPKYQAPQGQEIEVFLQWRDAKKKLHRVPAQHWIQSSSRRFFGEPLKQKPADLKIPKRSELQYDQITKELIWFGQMSEKQKTTLMTWSKDEDYQRALKKLFERSQVKEMQAKWVFAGSGFFKDEETGQEHYLAEGGEVICVANFPQAMLDLATRSSAQEAELLYEAATDRIPPLGTEVTVELIPNVAKKANSKATLLKKPADSGK